MTDRPDARFLKRAAGELRFSGVTFAYGDNPPVLNGLSFCIAPGTINSSPRDKTPDWTFGGWKARRSKWSRRS